LSLVKSSNYQNQSNSYGYKRYSNKNRSNYQKNQNKDPSWSSIAQKALKTAQYVAGLVNAEAKFVDTFQNAQNIDYIGTQVILCTPPQGVGSDERTGDSIKIKNLTLRGNIKRSTADCIVRIIVYWDKENSIPNTSSFLEQVGNSFSVISPRNESSKFRAKTLYDSKFIITADTPIQEFECVVKIDDHVNFAVNSTTLVQGALKILWVSNINANLPTLDYFARTTYMDN